MTRARLGLSILAVVVLGLVAGLSATGAGAQAAPNATADYTLGDLTKDGKHYTPDSFRIATDDERGFWIKYCPTSSPMCSISEAGEGGSFLSDTLVETNTLYLFTYWYDNEPVSRNLTIVSWERGQREIATENGTTTTLAAENVTAVTRSVTIEPGLSRIAVDLPQHNDQKRVTMWLEKYPEQARWTFKHRSSPLSRTVPLTTESDRWAWALGIIVVPAVIGSRISMGFAKKWVEAAGKGPGLSFNAWLILFAVLAGGFVLFAFGFAAQLIVAIPFVVAAALVGIMTAFALATHEGQTQKVLFFQPYITKIRAFDDLPDRVATADDGVASFTKDMPLGQFVEHDVIKDPNGVPSIIKDGLAAFWARAKGARAPLENYEQIEARMSLVESEWDEVVITDPKAERPIEDYSQEGWRFEPPDLDTWGARITALVAVGSFAGAVYFAAQAYGQWLLPIGALAGLVVGARMTMVPRDGGGRVQPAPAHLRPVLATAAVMQLGIASAENNRQLREMVAHLRQKRKASIEDLRDEVDRSIVEETHGFGDEDGPFSWADSNGHAEPDDEPEEEDGEEVDQV